MIERPAGGERAVLVHLHLKDPQLNADLREFRELALASGVLVVEVFTNNRAVPDAKYFIGSGKAEEIRQFVENQKIDVVLFNHEISPGQQRNLEKILCCRVLGRTALILDIFAQRARTFEGKLQVELAQLEHLASRLVRGWTHLERQKGGIGLRGPGETQLEVDRRLIRGRIKYIKNRLEKVRAQREQGRQSRLKASIPLVSLVGYTNAGKSTLFNALTGAHVFVANQLFATLDPTIRVLDLPTVGKIALSDTVGFIRHLPHHLVEAFRATLEETRNATLLLHVIDAHDEMWREQRSQVQVVLEEIGASEVPRIEVYNKIDLLPERSETIEYDNLDQVSRIWMSSQTGAGLELLLSSIVARLSLDVVRGQLQLPPSFSKIRAQLHTMGAIEQERIDLDGNWLLDIALLRPKWQQLCHHETGLVDYFSPMEFLDLQRE